MNTQPFINAGILSAPSIQFKLNGNYQLEGSQKTYNNQHSAFLQNGKIIFDNMSLDSMNFIPVQYETASFELFNVSIGIHFHWERTETQCFQGNLRFVIDKENIVAINRLLLEDYLLSVISSEMSATSSIELLKAHAVVSRSWLLAQLEKKDKNKHSEKGNKPSIITEQKIIRWYDREEHALFDVCADDHCQRYQGLTKASTSNVKEAISQTYGEVLMFNNEICDARYSKCCGGLTEEFENCWEPKHYPYLESVTCFNKEQIFTDPENWIMHSPPAFCNTNNKDALKQVLNDFDQETNEFYRWKISYTQKELSSLILKKTGMDFGEIIDLIPYERGKSGRIIQLLIRGTKKEYIIGKELEIRKTMSETHLYSSAFVVKKENKINDIPQLFILYGAGWGHGVGLCQIGAAMMAVQNYLYQDILTHYFRHSNIKKLYPKL